MLLKPFATGGSRPRVSGEPAHALPSICYRLRIIEFTPEAPSFTGLRVSGQDFEEFQGFVQSSQIRSPVGVLSKILCAAKAFLRAPSHSEACASRVCCVPWPSGALAEGPGARPGRHPIRSFTEPGPGCTSLLRAPQAPPPEKLAACAGG